jgi:gluconolactonase
MISSIGIVLAQEKSAVSLNDIIDKDAQAVVLGDGYKFCEGPAADAVGNVYFSDGGNDTIHFYAYGQPVRVFAGNCTDANGMMFNHKGELISVEGGLRRIVAFDIRTKEKRVLADQIDGTKFNEPNDVTVDFEDGFYFTDPYYKHRNQGALMKEDVYYVSSTGNVTRVSTVCKRPNGILLTADCKTLYVADNGSSKIYRYDVAGPGKLENETVFITDAPGGDGMTLDAKDNLYISCGGNGILVYDKTGKRIGVIGKEFGIPYASNCVFGGPGFSVLYVTSIGKFFGIPMKVKGQLSPCADLIKP